MIVPVVSVAAADPPNAQSAQPTATLSAESGPPTRACTPNPTAVIASRPASVKRMPMRSTSSALSIGPAMASSDAGSDSRPACRGDSPSTSCRYWLTRMNDPNETKTLRTLLASATLKAGFRNSRRSSIGSASVRWRRMKVAARPPPASIESKGSQLRPSWTVCFRP